MLITIPFICTLGGCDNKKEITQADAANIATVRLGEYAKRNNIPAAQFSEPDIRFDKKLELWEFYYESRESPKHSVNILVDKYGGAEVNSTLK